MNKRAARQAARRWEGDTLGDKNKGYVSIWRCIKDNPIWDNSDHLKAWIDLLLMANHKDKEIVVNNQPLTVHKGQKFTSIRHLAKEWGWSVHRVERYIELLVKLGMIYKSSTHNGTLLTIMNYGLYQDRQDTDGHTDDHEVGHAPIHTGGHTDGPQTIMLNNVNNDNNEINIERRPFSEAYRNEKWE